MRNELEKINTLCLLTEMKQLPTDVKAISSDFEYYLTHHFGHFRGCNDIYLYQALAATIRNRLMTNWRNTWLEFSQPDTRRGFYLSMEFLMGRALGNHLLNMQIKDETAEAMQSYSLLLEEIETEELDAGLGNGGLGRLAACFMDSCARLKLPVVGYGIRYQYGVFYQHIENGYQIEEPDHWLRDGNPWEIERPEFTQTIKFGGHCEHYQTNEGHQRIRWVDTDDVLAIPYDTPISGYANNIVNTMRLWSATATDKFNLHEFNAGSYTEAVAEKNNAEQITMVLYPNDASENGKALRLKQQYFLASASLQDIVHMWEGIEGNDYTHFAAQNVFQLNDTHPSIAVAELMRILIDEKQISWETAWDITRHSMAYTNHTLLPEALECWPVRLFESLLPRLLEIIYDINAQFLQEVSQCWPGDLDRLQRLSIIGEGESKYIRMAHLAIVGSFSVNGVAALHSQLLKDHLFHDFYEMWPEKFNNKTNGVTPRRWIAHANTGLCELLIKYIGDKWITDLENIKALSEHAENKNASLIKEWQAVRIINKQKLSSLVEAKTGVIFNPEYLFSVQVKRIHEYKRQLLNILHVIYLYNQIKRGKTDKIVNRCILIGGKAAPGYQLAKQIIKLINNVANMINSDPDIGDKIKLAFLPNYKVSSMEVIAPATDLSEQISTAGKEASGTGNMKFMMNGALTIGTYDGANIEIQEAVGEENCFMFGLHADEVRELKNNYNPQSIVDQDEDLKQVIDLLSSGFFNPVEPGIFDEIISNMLSPHDPWATLADFRSYINTQNKVSELWQQPKEWTLMSIRNVAASGFFSTDRTIDDYNKDIWHLKPLSKH